MNIDNTRINLNPPAGSMTNPAILETLKDLSKAHGPYDLTMNDGREVNNTFMKYDPINHKLNLHTTVPRKINGIEIPVAERQRMANGKKTNTMIVQTKKGPYALKMNPDGSIIKASVKKVDKKQIDIIKHDHLLKIRGAKTLTEAENKLRSIKHLLSPAELKSFEFEIQRKRMEAPSIHTSQQKEKAEKKEIRRSLKRSKPGPQL